MAGLHTQWIREACEANGVPELADRIRWEWSDRFTARMGDATFSLNRIRLSRPLWPRASDAERRQTVIHEACHLIAFYKYGRQGTGHGAYWKATMRRAGVSPKRCHNVDRSGLKQSRAKFAFDCACMTHMVGKIRANKIRAGVKYTCRRCKTTLKA